MNDNRGLWRGNRINNGEWVEGNLLRDYIPETAAIVTYVNLSGDVRDLSEINIFEADSSTLGECTGWIDKNGKLIFEGDIVEHNGKRFVIKYLEKYMRFSPVKPGTVFAVFDYTQSEIVGNIHDNPELMEG